MSQPPDSDKTPPHGIAVNQRRRWPLVVVGVTLVIGIVVAAWAIMVMSDQPEVGLPPATATPATRNKSQPATLAELLSLNNDELAAVDIGRMNLLCAVGLHGSEHLDVEASLRKLDEWAAWVRNETDRNFHRFTDKPEQFDNSEASFRMLMMITVLQQDFGVHYNKARIMSPDYSNSQDVLINGMIGSTNGGTCASMPVLYTAVARRLGYPVFLVLAKEHVFCRWDGLYGGRFERAERVNVDGAGEGGTTHPDSHYMTWPHPISQAEVDRGLYLRSLDPASTLATCLASRAYVCEDNGDLAGAQHAYAEAARRDHRDGMYAVMAARFGGKKKAAPPPFVPPVDGDPAVLDAWNRQQIQRLQEQNMPPPPPPPRVQKPIPGPYDR